MPLMTKYRTVTEAAQACKDDLEAAHAMGESPRGPYNVLRQDGDTDQYRIDASGKIHHDRKAGHLTMGMLVDPSDVPCVIA